MRDPSSYAEATNTLTMRYTNLALILYAGSTRANARKPPRAVMLSIQHGHGYCIEPNTLVRMRRSMKRGTPQTHNPCGAPVHAAMLSVCGVCMPVCACCARPDCRPPVARVSSACRLRAEQCGRNYMFWPRAVCHASSSVSVGT